MLIDLTHTMTEEMPVYPGTAAPVFNCKTSRSGGQITRLDIESHMGTHMDAPRHMLLRGCTLETLPVSHFCGRALVLDVSELSSITAEFLKDQNGAVHSADFVLFYTGWAQKWGTEEYFADTYPILEPDAAAYLVSCGLKGVGVDVFSVDRLKGGEFPIHKILLDGGLLIVENLCLKKNLTCRKDIRFFALPMKYKNADGAPVRAVAELRDTPEKEMDALCE